MSILMPHGKHWLVSDWVSHGFFEDCSPHLDTAPLLKADIQFCIDASVDTLDLRDRKMEAIRELKILVKSVIENNVREGDARFYSPEHYPVYLKKIKELETLISSAE